MRTFEYDMLTEKEQKLMNLYLNIIKNMLNILY